MDPNRSPALPSGSFRNPHPFRETAKTGCDRAGHRERQGASSGSGSFRTERIGTKSEMWVSPGHRGCTGKFPKSTFRDPIRTIDSKVAQDKYGSASGIPLQPIWKQTLYHNKTMCMTTPKTLIKNNMFPFPIGQSSPEHQGVKENLPHRQKSSIPSCIHQLSSIVNLQIGS